MIHKLSLSSLFLEFYLTEDSEKPLATGTGFTTTLKGREEWFLITNWHCVTGRNPENNNPLSDNGLCDPEFVKVYFHSQEGKGIWNPIMIQLRDENGIKWVEHERGSEIDIVAIPIINTADIVLHNFERAIKGNGLLTEPSDNVSIIGYPKGLSAGGKYPIWKTGTIATDFEINWEDKPMFLIDATTRKGMSGSPVVMKKDGFCHFDDNTMKTGKFTKFMGVYSGRIDDDIELGRVWKGKAMLEVIAMYYRANFPELNIIIPD
jgi:hypothetical protein